MRLLTSVVPLAITLCTSSTVLGGPWTKDQGRVYVKVNQGFFVSGSGKDSTGLTMSTSANDISYFGATTSAYFEIGLLQKSWGALQLIA